MQLDSAIEQRRRELDNVTNDIDNDKNNNENNGQELRNKRVGLLNAQLDKSKVAFDNSKLKLMGDRYNEIATSKFKILPFFADLLFFAQTNSSLPCQRSRQVLTSSKSVRGTKSSSRSLTICADRTLVPTRFFPSSRAGEQAKTFDSH